MATEPTTQPTTPPAPPDILERHAAPIQPYHWPGWIPIVLGAWLFVSAFLWPHGTASATNTWIVGALIVIASLVALRMPWMRWVDTALAIWLFLSALAMSDATRGTLWNNLIVAVLVFLVSLVPEGVFPTPHWRIRGGAPARGSGLGR